jgi:hypothetical protein
MLASGAEGIAVVHKPAAAGDLPVKRPPALAEPDDDMTLEQGFDTISSSCDFMASLVLDVLARDDRPERCRSAR